MMKGETITPPTIRGTSHFKASFLRIPILFGKQNATRTKARVIVTYMTALSEWVRNIADQTVEATIMNGNRGNLVFSAVGRKLMG